MIIDEKFEFIEQRDGGSLIAQYTENGNKKELTVFSFVGDIKNVVIPNFYKGAPITKVAPETFKNAHKLKSVTYENDFISTIFPYTFWSCENLEKINFPNDLRQICGYAVNNCEKIKELIFPESLLEINENAFENCDNIKSVIFKGDRLETIAYNLFPQKTKIKVDCENTKNVLINEGYKVNPAESELSKLVNMLERIKEEDRI